MASDKMLIDAAHPEETRVVVLRGNRIEEFDYESAAKKLLRGNIYLAKITRVEPSLQAAFVDYGGNRHGFLAFSEMHPDYYQIPVADRQALLREEAEEAAEEARRDASEDHAPADDGRAYDGEGSDQGPTDIEEAGGGSVPWDVEDVVPAPHEDAAAAMPPSGESPAGEGSMAEERRDPVIHGVATVADLVSAHEAEPYAHSAESQPGAIQIAHDIQLGQEQPWAGPGEGHAVHADAPPVDELAHHHGLGHDHSHDHGHDHVHDHSPAGADDPGAAHAGQPAASADAPQPEETVEEAPERKRRPRRAQYKIQEVIKRRQIILVQVVKEERGNKGAALTTYLSLAGRYTVLMPNTARGGGISRKITNAVDRRRLKEITSELEVPDGMGLIVRTAGASRTTAEIKRDHDYLLRLWESIRDLTLKSTAPALVYEEGSLVKRSIRDLYSKDIEEVVVAGSEAYESARDFMRMLMPSHAKNVKHYESAEPLFARYQIERQLNAMYSPYVTLKSGGYIVLNQTEALVAIDVNSGKSTREHNIEDTALNTNLEACDEVARQLRLRDLAGLIVIDFIDMDERRNNRAVENRLKNALKHDRARIQVGRISHFGLMEMSRQRLRTGVLEGSTSQCPHCMGTGVIRSTESVALAVLRALEDNLMGHAPRNMVATTSIEVALYLLNEKRAYLRDIEARYGVVIEVDADAQLQGANFRIDATGAATGVPETPRPRHAVQLESGFDANGAGEGAAEAAEADEDMVGSGVEDVSEASEDAGEDNGEPGERKRSRRRRRRRGERGDRPERGHGEHDGQSRAENGSDSGMIVVDTSGEGRDLSGADEGADEPADGDDDAGSEANGVGATGEGERGERRGRRRGRRGGRRNRRGGREGVASEFESGKGGEPHGGAPVSDALLAEVPFDEVPAVAGPAEPAHEGLFNAADSDQPAVPPDAWGLKADSASNGESRQPAFADHGRPIAEVSVATAYEAVRLELAPHVPSVVTSHEPDAATEAARSVAAAAVGSAFGNSGQPVEPADNRVSEQPLAAHVEPAQAAPAQPAEPAGPPKRGWWSKRFSGG